MKDKTEKKKYIKKVEKNLCQFTLIWLTHYFRYKPIKKIKKNHKAQDLIS